MTTITGKYMNVSAIIALLLLTVFTGCGESADHTVAIERHKKLAGELRDSRLYSAAIEEYEKVLSYETLDDPSQANINYLIGRIYYENLTDYEHAAAYYTRAKTLDPNGSFMADVSRNLIASLEKMGRMVDAKRQLDAAVDLDAGPRDDKDVIVARIGGVPIWLSEIDDQIQSLSPEMQKQLFTSKAKVDFVHQHVGLELIYHAAVRENYGDDAQIKRQLQLFNKQLLVDKYVRDKVMPQIQIDTADVRNFYLANRDTRYADAPYDSVQVQVFLDYQTQKAQSAFNEYIQKLAQVERVEFLDQNVR